MKKTVLNLFGLFIIAISFNSCASLTACDCWEQSYTKSGLEFDKMSEAQQKTRANCVDLFNNENNMEVECIEATKNYDNSDNSLDTKIVTMKLPPKKQQNKLNIGDKVFGGVIIEIDKSGLHGLVMALEDQDNFIIKQEDDLPNKEFNRAFKVCNELILNGFSEYKKVTAISVYSYVAGLLISLFLMWKYGINGALISISVLSVFQFLFSGYYFVQHFSFQLILLNRKIDFRSIKHLLPLGLMTLFSAVLSPIIYIFIRNLLSREVSLDAAGHFEAMQRISGFYMMFITTLITFYFLPELTKAKSLDKERKLTFAFYKGIIPIFGFGLVLIYFLRNFVIQVLLTKEFELVSDLFLWQLLGDFFRALSLILGIRFYSKKMMKDYFVTEIVSFTVLFSSSYLLIPKLGSEGAVMAYAITYGVYFVVLLIYFRKLFYVEKS